MFSEANRYRFTSYTFIKLEHLVNMQEMMHAHVPHIDRYTVCPQSYYGSMWLLTFRLDVMHLTLAFCRRKTFKVFLIYLLTEFDPVDTPYVASNRRRKFSNNFTGTNVKRVYNTVLICYLLLRVNTIFQADIGFACSILIFLRPHLSQEKPIIKQRMLSM